MSFRAPLIAKFLRNRPAQPGGDTQSFGLCRLHDLSVVVSIRASEVQDRHLPVVLSMSRINTHTGTSIAIPSDDIHP